MVGRGEDQSGPCLVIWVKIYEYTETNDVCFKNGKMKALRFQMGFTVRFQTMGKIFGHKIENKWMLKFFAALKYPWVRSGIKLSSSDMNVSVKHLYLSLITTFLFLFSSTAKWYFIHTFMLPARATFFYGSHLKMFKIKQHSIWKFLCELLCVCKSQKFLFRQCRQRQSYTARGMVVGMWSPAVWLAVWPELLVAWCLQIRIRRLFRGFHRRRSPSSS